MRVPVHVVYGGAHLFKSGIARKLGNLAAKSVDSSLASEEVLARVRAKLDREPIEDFRIDFEDGYGIRPDDEEDVAAKAAGHELAKGDSPPFIGIRIKREPERGYRTLDLFLDAAGTLPPAFVVTLSKVEEIAEVTRFRARYPSLHLEIMVETPNALRRVRGLVQAAAEKLTAVHFGPYDFLSSCGVPGPAQRLAHPLCDQARRELVIALAGMDIRISDGPTALLPVGSTQAIAAARNLQRANILNALDTGILQGWDLHPAQVAVRYSTLFAYFLTHADAQRVRLENYLDRKAQATRVGGTFDDAATARGLMLFFERARDCGALKDGEMPEGLLPLQ